MEIGINALKLFTSHDYRNAGVSHYIRQLSTHLLDVDSANRYTLFTNHLMPTWQERTRNAPHIVSSRFPTARPALRILWEQTVLAWHTTGGKLDVLHCPLNVIPMAAACATVVTVHDLAFLRYPKLFPRLKQRYLKLFTRLSAQRAGAVIAVSASTRADVIAMLSVPPERVSVVYSAADPDFKPCSESERKAFRESKGLTGGYVLYVGTLEPRKNVDVLIRAFGTVVRQERLPHRLVLVGARGWMTQPIGDAILAAGIGDRLLEPGYVAREELPMWYSCADLLVYPSSYEGFGYPLLEAMAAGTPVIASNTSSMPEVAGAAGLLVPPRSEQELACAVTQVLTDRALADSMRERGLTQAARFTWSDSVGVCLQLYEALGSHPP